MVIYRDSARGVTPASLRFLEEHAKKLAPIEEVRVSFKPLCVTGGGRYHTVISDVNGDEVWLSGCTAGYRGSGPHGTAFVLRQLGLPVPPRLFSAKRKPLVVRAPVGKLRSSGRRSRWLTKELWRLQELFQWGQELRVNWNPNRQSEREGEVAGNLIHVYSKTRPDAIRTLRHEFLDKLISRAIEPYSKMLDLARIMGFIRSGRPNRPREWERALNDLLNESEGEAYREKEAVVEKFSVLVDQLRKLGTPISS